MKIEYIVTIAISAFLHALYNFYMRKSLGSRMFLMWMFIFSGVWGSVFLLVYGKLYPEVYASPFPWQSVPFIFGAAFFYSVYQVFVSQSYQRGDISRYYPLTVLSPIFIPLWATLFLSEHISLLTLAGIIIATSGALVVKLNRFTWAEFKKMFRFSSDYTGARFALGASLIYSFGAVFDKSRIAHFPLPVYLAILLFFMAINSVVYSSFIEKGNRLPYFYSHWKSIIIAGFLVFLSFITFRVALRVAPVSIVVPIRQVAIVFAILLGVFCLKEKFRLSSLVGSLIIILGIIVVNAGS